MYSCLGLMRISMYSPTYTFLGYSWEIWQWTQAPYMIIWPVVYFPYTLQTWIDATCSQRRLCMYTRHYLTLLVALCLSLYQFTWTHSPAWHVDDSTCEGGRVQLCGHNRQWFVVLWKISASYLHCLFGPWSSRETPALSGEVWWMMEEGRVCWSVTSRMPWESQSAEGWSTAGLLKNIKLYVLCILHTILKVYFIYRILTFKCCI